MNRSTRSRLLAPSALAAALAIAACSPQGEQTVGQKVDETVAGARSGADNAAQATRNAASDSLITTKINAALAADDQLKATKIDVDTTNGHVVLTGTAPDIASRDRATTLAKAVDGVVRVDNRLTLGGG